MFLRTPTWRSGGLKLFITSTAYVALKLLNLPRSFSMEDDLFILLLKKEQLRMINCISHLHLFFTISSLIDMKLTYLKRILSS